MNEEKLSLIHEDIKDIKGQVIELVKQGAVHNQILHEHEKRSTMLETRLMPIEATYHFIVRAGALISLVTGIGSLLVGLYRIYH